ncbi:MAG: DUF1345 domain-containing protein [Sphingomicrobium sp.]
MDRKSAGPPRRRIIGNSIAPWRFLLFFVTLVVASLSGVLSMEDPWLGLMVGFDIAAAIFLISCLSILSIRDPEVIERAAERNDANRTELLALTGIVMAVLLISIAAETANMRPEPWTKIIIILTLLLAWLFSNMVYALHYAHMAYVQPSKGCEGLAFPNTPLPVYWDFVYFAFTIGMTFQTSDIAISSDQIRRVATVHSFAAFVFNIGVLAFTINVLGSS